MALGYACINMTLDSSSKNLKVTTNRSMIKKTYASRGNQYASQLALANCQDLYKIIQWNEKNGIKFFRISSEMFPWASEYDISSLPDYQEIRAALEKAGSYARSIGQRLTFHPGPFNKLPSEDPNVIKNTTRDLEIHGEIFDLLNLPQTPYAKINIHVGAAYDDKLKACKTFIKNFKNLSHSVRSRLTVENDDKASLYSTRELYDLIYKEIGIPIVFDYHHHTFCEGGQSEQEALELAISTWNGITPVVHYSESRSLEQQDRTIKPQAHSDYVYNYINTYGHNVDVMIEAKQKELALLKYRKLHQDKVTGDK
jgi:UV DNA damage endonuclease